MLDIKFISSLFLFVCFLTNNFIQPTPFSDLFIPVESKMFSGASLTDQDKTNIFNSIVSLANGFNTWTSFDKADLKDLIQYTLAKSSKFSATQQGIFSQILTSINSGQQVPQTLINQWASGAAAQPAPTSTPASTNTSSSTTANSSTTTTTAAPTQSSVVSSNYTSLSQRLSALPASLLSGTFEKAKATSIVANLDSWRIEYYGADIDNKPAYLLAINMVKNKCINAGFSDLASQLDAIAADINTPVSWSNKILFLSRVATATTTGAFLDQAERTIFMNVARQLTDNLKSLTVQNLTDLYGSFSFAYSSNFFLQPEKDLINTYSQKLLSYYTSMPAQTTATATTTTSTTASTTNTTTSTGPSININNISYDIAADILGSFADGDMLIISFGSVDNPSYKSVYATSLDANSKIIAAHSQNFSQIIFKIRKNPDNSFSLEVANKPGMFLTFTTSLMAQFQDVTIKAAVAPTDNENSQYFFLAKSKVDNSKYCLISSKTNGFLTVLSDNSISFTDFQTQQPFAESTFSTMKFIKVTNDQFITELVTAFSQTDATKFDFLTKWSKQAITNQDQAGMFLRAILYWLYEKRRDSATWTSFATQSNISKIDATLKQVSSLPANAKTFSLFANLIAAIRDVLEFPSDIQISAIVPTTNNPFWLSEQTYAFKKGLENGLSFSAQNKDSFAVLVDDKPGATVSASGYKILVADNSIDEASYEVVLKKNDMELIRVSMQNFTQDAFTQYQLIINNSTIKFLSENEQFFEYTDPTFSLKNEQFFIGFEAYGNDYLYLDSVLTGFSVYYEESIQQMQQAPYGKSAATLASFINNITTSTDPKLISDNLKKAVMLSTLPFRLEGSESDYQAIKDALLSLQAKLKSRPQKAKLTNNQITDYNTAAQNFAKVPDWNMRLAMLDRMLKVCTYYDTATNKDDATMTYLITVSMNNLQAASQHAFDQVQKDNFKQWVTAFQQCPPFASQASVLEQMKTDVDSLVKMELTSQTMSDNIAQARQILNTIKTLGQRTSFFVMLYNTLIQKSKTSTAEEKTLLKNFINNEIANATLFKDVLGSVQLAAYVLDNGTLSEIFARMMQQVSGRLQPALTPDQFIANLQALSDMILNTFYANGLRAEDLVTIDALSASISTVRTDPAVAAKVNFIDLIALQLKTRGSLEDVATSIRNEVTKIANLTQRDIILDKIDKLMVSMIEQKLLTSSVSDEDRNTVLNLLASLKGDQTQNPPIAGNAWFKDTAAITKLDSFRARTTAQSNPFTKLAAMKTSYANLVAAAADGSLTGKVDQFVADIKTFAQSIIDYTNSQIATQADIDAYNDFISKIIADTADQNASGARYLIYIYRFRTQPTNANPNARLNLEALKIGSNPLADVINQVNNLNSILNSDLSSVANRDAFNKALEKMVLSWKMAVIFNPTVHDQTNSGFKIFYDKARAFFDAALKNIYLNQFVPTIDVYREDILEDMFEVVEKIAILTNFIKTTPDFAGKQISDMILALNKIIDEVIKLKCLSFDKAPDISSANALVDLYSGNAKLNAGSATVAGATITAATEKSRLAAPITNLQRITALNQEMADAVTSPTTLTQTQQDNITAIVTDAANFISQSITSADQAAAEITKLKNYIQTLLNAKVFDDADTANLSAALTKITTVETSLVNNTTAVTAQPVVPTSATPVVVSNPVVVSAPVVQAPVTAQQTIVQAPGMAPVAVGPSKAASSNIINTAPRGIFGSSPMASRSIGVVVQQPK